MSPAPAPWVTASQTTYLALLRVFPDVCLTRIVMQGYVGSFQDQQELRLVLVYPFECLIQSCITVTAGEYPIEALFKLCLFVLPRGLFVGFQVPVEFPYPGSYLLKGIAL